MEISNNFIKALIPQLVIYLQNIKESGLEQNDDKSNIVEEIIKTLLTINTVANESQSKYIFKKEYIFFVIKMMKLMTYFLLIKKNHWL